MNNQHNTV